MSALSQAQAWEETMSVESSGKPDAMKVARPVWGWGRGEIPRPTPQVQEVEQLRYAGKPGPVTDVWSRP